MCQNYPEMGQTVSESYCYHFLGQPDPHMGQPDPHMGKAHYGTLNIEIGSIDTGILRVRVLSGIMTSSNIIKPVSTKDC